MTFGSLTLKNISATPKSRTQPDTHTHPAKKYEHVRRLLRLRKPSD